MISLLQEGLSALHLDASRAEMLERFASLLLEKNKVMNLTRITEPQDVAQLHLLDSAVLLTLADFADAKVLDVGSGAGFPGIPLRILRDDFDLTLLDSLGKRVDWLAECCETLGLQRVSCVNARAEEFAQANREAFDLVTARAVAALNVLCELCLPAVRVGGRFLAMKSVDSDAEIAAAKRAVTTLGGEIERIADYRIPTAEVMHRLVVIRKVKPTPATYPRTFAKIKKMPL